MSNREVPKGKKPGVGEVPTDGVSLVVPTFSEAENLPVFIPRLARSLGRLSCPAEIIIVDDDSPDKTAALAESLAEGLEVPLTVLRRRGRVRSLAGSVVDGARKALYAHVAILDADLSHDPESIPELLAPLRSRQADVVVGSRYRSGARVRSWPLRRSLLSRIGTLLAKAITPIGDPLSGYFACRRDLLDGSTLHLKPNGYKILPELLGRSRGLRVREVPIDFQDRSAGESKLGFRQLVEFGCQVVTLLFVRLGVGRSNCKNVSMKGV